jgi:hypothetical protein
MIRLSPDGIICTFFATKGCHFLSESIFVLNYQFPVQHQVNDFVGKGKNSMTPLKAQRKYLILVIFSIAMSIQSLLRMTIHALQITKLYFDSRSNPFKTIHIFLNII